MAREARRGDAPLRVAVCISHPVVYFCALYASLAADPRLDVTVVFTTRTGTTAYHDAEFAGIVDPGLGPLLARFPHRFLLDTPDLGRERELTWRSLASALDELDPEVVVVYGFNRWVSRFGLVWAGLRRRPLVYLSDSEDRGVRTTARPVTALKRVLASFVLRRPDRVFAVGDANEQFYLRRGVHPGRLVRVPFPIDREAFTDLDGRAAAQASALRSEHGLEGSRVVLSSGKLVPRKRQGDLVAALARSANRTGTVLVLLGTGPDQDALRDAAGRSGIRLVMPGFVRPAELLPWYLLADVYAHVSDFDPHPLAVSEAVYSGLPVIVSDRTGSWGPSDDVIPGLNGLVVPTGDVAAITEAIDRMLVDEGNLATMAAASATRGQELQAAAYRGFADALVDLAHTGRRR
jgi:glycosyltransferase involved in cell wall biosynthesis